MIAALFVKRGGPYMLDEESKKPQLLEEWIPDEPEPPPRTP